MKRFDVRLGMIAVVALSVRVAAAWANRHYPVQGDALTYHLTAASVAAGDGFVAPLTTAPTAEHPPAHIVVLALADLLGFNSTAQQAAYLGGVGTVTVTLIGVLGRRVGRERLGLIAAGIAAVYPMLWLPDQALMSETTSTLCVVICLLAAFALRDRRTVGAALGLGAAIGLAALARGEALALVVLLLLPVAWLAADGDRRRALVLGATAVLAVLVVIAPWQVRNAVRFNDPVLISTNGAGVWAGANCPRTYYGELTGSWVFSCYGTRPAGDESQRASVYRTRGVDYLRDHIDRLPAVMLARLGRQFDVWPRWNQSQFFAGTEGRRPSVQRAGLIAYWIAGILAVVGFVVLRRRGAPLIELLAPLVLVVLVGVFVYGNTRFRTAAEPSIMLGAAVVVELLLVRALQRVRPRRSQGDSASDAKPPTTADGSQLAPSV